MADQAVRDSQELADNVHVHNIPLRWNDFDRYGHVTNSAYIELAQEARLAFAQENFYSRGHEFVVFVRHLEADYLRPLLPNTVTATVETQVVRVGNTSFTTRQEIKDAKGRVCCAIECVQVTVDNATTSPREITTKEIGILSQTAASSALEG